MLGAVFGDPMGITFKTHWDTSSEWAALRDALYATALEYGHDKLAQRIDGLVDMLVIKGVYDASIPELARLFKEAGCRCRRRRTPCGPRYASRTGRGSFAAPVR